MAVVYLSLGSNLGDRFTNLNRAIKLLSQYNIVVKNISPIYETEPVGRISVMGISCPFQTKTYKFLNCVIETENEFDPIKLLSITQSIEKSLGRKQSKLIRNRPRLIDIDILFYNDKIINKPMLKIPHPQIEHRAFVLIPLSDLTPDFVHPVLKKTIRELTNKINKKGVSLWQTKAVLQLA